MLFIGIYVFMLLRGGKGWYSICYIVITHAGIAVDDVIVSYNGTNERRYASSFSSPSGGTRGEVCRLRLHLDEEAADRLQHFTVMVADETTISSNTFISRHRLLALHNFRMLRYCEAD